MCIDEELDALRESVAELEQTGGTLDAWRRIDARAFLAVLAGQMHLTCLQRDMVGQLRTQRGGRACSATHLAIGELVEKLNEIRTLRAVAQERVTEVALVGDQRVLDAR